jgi:hypothetical protein
MIKAKGRDTRGNPVFFFGLSEENLRRLRLGQPIRIDLNEMGLDGTAFILYGRSEEAILAQFAEEGLLAEDLITHPIQDAQG